MYQRAGRSFACRSDEASAHFCRHEAINALLEEGETDNALPLLIEGDGYVQGNPDDHAGIVRHALDWSAFLYGTGEYQKSAQVAFGALEATEDLELQARAHLRLARAAIAMSKPQDALSFALAARVAAIDGRFYGLEFEAAEMIFRLLRSHGAAMLQELEAEFMQHGVDIYQYISEDWYRRFARTH